MSVELAKITEERRKEFVESERTSLKDYIKTRFYPLYLTVSRIYLFFLDRIVMKLFARPDIAIRCAVSQEKPTPERVISSYYQGLYLIGENRETGFVWRSSPYRAVITTESAHVPKRVRQHMKKEMFDIRKNERFYEVIRKCQHRDRHDWINEPIVDIYNQLHDMGYAASFEAYQDDELAAGMWGLEIGSTYSILSMFHHVDHAGSVLLGTMVKNLKKSQFNMIDCGLMNENFRRYGASKISKDVFIDQVVRGCAVSVHNGANGRSHNPVRANGNPHSNSETGKNT